MYKTAKYAEAEREFNKVLEQEPDNAEVLFYLGLTEMMRNEYAKAKGHFQAALEQDERTSVLVNLSYACSCTEQYEEALGYLDRAKNMEPENLKVMLNRGMAQYNIGDFEAAGQTFQQSLKISEDALTPYIYSALISERKGKVEEAVDYLQRGLDKFPRSAEAKNNLALMYESLGRYEDAERLYCKILASQPEINAVIRNLAGLYYRLGLYGAARQYYEQVPEEDRIHEDLVNLGRLHMLGGETENAIRVWQTALSMNPDDQFLSCEIETLQSLISATE